MRVNLYSSAGASLLSVLEQLQSSFLSHQFKVKCFAQERLDNLVELLAQSWCTDLLLWFKSNEKWCHTKTCLRSLAVVSSVTTWGGRSLQNVHLPFDSLQNVSLHSYTHVLYTSSYIIHRIHLVGLGSSGFLLQPWFALSFFKAFFSHPLFQF